MSTCKRCSTDAGPIYLVKEDGVSCADLCSRINNGMVQREDHYSKIHINATKYNFNENAIPFDTAHVEHSGFR